jgi:hypothetical protein
MRFDVSVHFVAANGTYQGQVIVSKAGSVSTFETMTLTLRAKHSTAAGAIDDASEHAERIQLRERYSTLFDQIFTSSDAE